MRAALITLFLLVLAAIGGAAALLFAAVEDAPRVARPVAIGPEQIARGKQIVEGQHPSRRREGALASMTLVSEDADLAVNYLVGRFAHGSAQVVLGDGTAHVVLSAPLPENPIGPWLNVDVDLQETPALPVVTAMRVGRVPLPGLVAQMLGDRALDWLRSRPEARAGLDALQGVRLTSRGATVLFDWHDDLPDRIRADALPAAQRERLRFYQDRLAAIPGGRVSLTELLSPLMSLAASRSVNGDTVAENQAAIVVLTMHVLGKPLELLDPAAAGWARLPRRTVTLANRDDFPKHFMVSAALAALAGTTLADAVGLYKEIEDSRGGSGFSFNDIAADRAGTRFGQMAVDASGARSLQVRLGGSAREADVFPPTADLPEFMTEDEFKARFGGVDAPAYRRMMEDIERRIAALPALR